MLPLLLVSIIIGNYEDLKDLKIAANAIESFKNYCSKLPVSSLRRLVAENCFQELKELFVSVPISNTYDLCYEDGEIIVKKIYDKFFADT